MARQKTLRIGRRYIRFEIISNYSPSKRELEKLIQNAVLTLFGEYGYSHIMPMLITWDDASRSGIVRCARGEEEKLKAAFALLPNLGGEKAHVRIWAVSGTLRKLRRGQHI